MITEKTSQHASKIEEVRSELLLTFLGFMSSESISENNILYKGREFLIDVVENEDLVLRFTEKNVKTTGITFNPEYENAEHFKEKVYLFAGVFNSDVEE